MDGPPGGALAAKDADRASAAPAAYLIHEQDNVATLLEDVTAGAPVRVFGARTVPGIAAIDGINEGHKIATAAIEAGSDVIKYGVSIGRATANIQPGEWVHLQNCESRYDAHSSTLELYTGASTDMTYE